MGSGELKVRRREPKGRGARIRTVEPWVRLSGTLGAAKRARRDVASSESRVEANLSLEQEQALARPRDRPRRNGTADSEVAASTAGSSSRREASLW